MKIKSLACMFMLASFAVHANPTILQVVEKDITVNGKSSHVFDVVQPDGKFGYSGKQGEIFDVTVQNKTKVPLVLHWHGITSPNPDDGVPYVTQYPINPGKDYHYKFRLTQEGTYWLHSHYKLQEQKLMAAPLIIHDPKAAHEQEALMFIQDFSFTDPKVLYARLKKQLQNKTMHMNMDMSMQMSSKPDVNDVKFDAYLTNHRTLQNPEIVRVTEDKDVRLRIINASASSSYFIDLDKLQGTLIAIDGAPIEPMQGSVFQATIGNRLDIRVHIPKGEGAYPILALPEDTKQQTGLILATTNATIPNISEKTATTNGILDYSQELKAHAAKPFKQHAVQRSLVYNLEGDMKNYTWTMNGQMWPNVTPFVIKPGQRIEIVFNNKTGMQHPMHFHGHVFQITEIDGKQVNGRQGDTINVMPNTSLKVVFNSDNPGIWMLHCHILYHQAGGMMTTVNYEKYPDRFTLQQTEEGEKLYY